MARKVHYQLVRNGEQICEPFVNKSDALSRIGVEKELDRDYIVKGWLTVKDVADTRYWIQEV